MVDSIMSFVTPQLTSSLASRFGGAAPAVQMGLGTSVAAVLATIADKSGDSPLMSQVFNLINSSNSHSILSSLPNLVSGGVGSGPVAERGSRLLSLLLGGHQSSVEGLIARQSGLSSTAGSGLMTVAAALVMGFLGQRVQEMNLNASSFADLIGVERPKLQALLPSGIGGFLSTPSRSIPSIVSSVSAAPSSAGGRKPLLIVIGLLVAGLLTWLGTRGCSTNPAQEAASKMADTASQVATATNGLGDLFKKRLPDGTDLNIPRLGLENKLIEFIEDSSKPVDQTAWFDFDRLLFATGKATLQPSSAEQLQNIAAILKAYPKVKIKIGGYTDNTGSKQGNLRLSGDRATNVMTELVQLGVDGSRVRAEGYGDGHPVADNATQEGRAKNRRISLRITDK